MQILEPRGPKMRLISLAERQRRRFICCGKRSRENVNVGIVPKVFEWKIWKVKFWICHVWKITSNSTAVQCLSFGAGGVQRFSLLPIVWCSWGCRGSWRVCIQAQCQAGSLGSLVKDNCMGDPKGSSTGLQQRDFRRWRCNSSPFVRTVVLLAGSSERAAGKHAWKTLGCEGNQRINFTFVIFCLCCLTAIHRHFRGAVRSQRSFSAQPPSNKPPCNLRRKEWSRLAT